jgi:dTMP kinase
MIYSAAKQNKNLTLQWAKSPDVGLPRPDMVLFLDLEETKAKERGGWGNEVYEKAEMQRRVRELFWSLANGTIDPSVEWGTFNHEKEDLVVVDASPSVEDVAEDIWKKVKPRLEEVERGDFGSVVRKVS